MHIVRTGSIVRGAENGCAEKVGTSWRGKSCELRCPAGAVVVDGESGANDAMRTVEQAGLEGNGDDPSE